MSAPGAARSRREASRERLGLPGVRAPKPLLSPETERALTERQREVLAKLETLLADEKLPDLTMAQIAAEANCSLRTLYGIAPSRDELILMLVDRRLHRIGRAAVAKLDPALAPLDALRAYLRAAHEAVQPEAIAFSRTFADVPGASRLLDAHEAYVVAVARNLLDRAAAAGDIIPVDTGAVAHVLGGLGREFARPEVAELLASPPKATADTLADLLLRGLRT